MSDPLVRILVVGGGHVGMYTALGIQRKLTGLAQVTVVDPQSNMTYQPFLPEAAAGAVEPRHVVVSLRRVLRRCEVLTAAVTRVEHTRRAATVQPVEGEPYEVPYDLLVMCPGSVSRLLPVPGLAEYGIGFKTLGEAIYLRNHVLSRLYLAASTPEPALRRRALTFVFVGGGYAGVEAISELQDMACYALRYVDDIEPRDMRWMLVEAADRIMPEVSPSLAAYTVDRLAEHGIDVRLSTRLESATDERITLSDGDTFPADTLVWTAGVKANPLLQQTDLPLDAKGRLPCNPDLTVRDVADVFAAGDCAAVPDLSKIAEDPDALCGPSAQTAVRQARRLADNLVATVHGRPRKNYKHAYAGSVASLGLYRGVAEIYGIKLRGIPAWLLHRTYHLTRMPTLNRKIRVLTDWTAALFFRREVVSLGQLQQPRTEFEVAAGRREVL